MSEEQLPAMESAGSPHHPRTATAPAIEIVKTVDAKEVKISNPAYEAWAATDQQVVGFLLSPLTKEALQQVVTSILVRVQPIKMGKLLS